MRIKPFLGMLFSASVLAGCVSTAPTSDDTVRFMASDRAMQLLEEQGKARATMLSTADYAEDTDLVCERFHQTGSHIVTSFCYTRAEQERRRQNHQDVYRWWTKGGPCPAPGGGGIASGRVASCGG